MVPLDRRIDFLTLAGGKRSRSPSISVFATNLDPAKMMDEAFLRRIQTKIKVGFVTPEQFREIIRRACLKLNIECSAALVDELVTMVEMEYKESPRACHPYNILQWIIWNPTFRFFVSPPVRMTIPSGASKKTGPFVYPLKPFDPIRLNYVVERALCRHRLERSRKKAKAGTAPCSNLAAMPS